MQHIGTPKKLYQRPANLFVSSFIAYPEEGASASTFGCALINGAKHPNAAKAMINYLMSADGQSELGTALKTLRFTNTKAVYDTKCLPACSESKRVHTLSGLFKGKRGPGVLAFCISLHQPIDVGEKRVIG